MSSAIFASLKKEFLLLSRDLHALLVLFLMPAAFVLIMSLALQDQIGGKTSISIPGNITFKQASPVAEELESTLASSPYLKFGTDDPLFSIEASEKLQASVEDEFDGEAVLSVTFSVKLNKREQMLVLAAIREAYAQVNVYTLAKEMGYDDAYARSQLLKVGAVQATLSANDRHTPHSATQQNVPAWLVFGMFFVSLPIATVVISERKQKTLLRLRSMGVAPSLWMLSKLFPYFVVNMLQLLAMLAVGVWLLPLLGGQALSLSFSWGGMLVIAIAVSIAALGYAAFVAVLSKTTEQAVIVAGTSNILFGALGGIMVPSFVMPEFMRWVTQVSPMGWGLQGFLEVISEGKGVSEVMLESSVLIAFGVAMVIMSSFIFKRQSETAW